MSKKNKLSTRRKQHDFDLQRAKEEKQRHQKKLDKSARKMQVDVKKPGISKKGKGFKVGKGRKFQLRAAMKAKVAQAMELDS